MVQYAIPGFRLTDEAIEKDFKRVTDLGVQIHYNHKIDRTKFQVLKKTTIIFLLVPVHNSQLLINLKESIQKVF